MPRINYKDESRKNWGCRIGENENVDHDQIKLGAILRIADSLEKMEQPFTRLLDRIEYLEGSSKRMSDRLDKASRRIAAYKGVIKKMKKQKV